MSKIFISFLMTVFEMINFPGKNPLLNHKINQRQHARDNNPAERYGKPVIRIGGIVNG